MFPNVSLKLNTLLYPPATQCVAGSIQLSQMFSLFPAFELCSIIQYQQKVNKDNISFVAKLYTVFTIFFQHTHFLCFPIAAELPKPCRENNYPSAPPSCFPSSPNLLCIIKCLQQTNVLLATPGGFKFTKLFTKLGGFFPPPPFFGQEQEQWQDSLFLDLHFLEANSLARKKLFCFLFP